MFARNKTNNFTNLISIDFETDIKIDESIDPYDSIWLKCITVMVIVVEMSASVIIWAFVAFETRGYAGHYRTAINQLLSCLYGGVSKMNPSTNLTNIFKIVNSMSRQMAIYADEWALKSTLISIISL